MKVLVVDDEVISRRLLQNYVQKWGYEATVAENGALAWDLLQKEHFPILISDWVMPEVDGLELIRRIRARPKPSSSVYAILITARAQKEDLVQAMEAGADDFISKPFDRDELRVRLRAGERFVRLEQALADHNQRLSEMEQKLTPASNNTDPTGSNSLTGRLEHVLAVLEQVATAGLVAQAGPDNAETLGECQQEIRDILSCMRGEKDPNT
jgi:DNA-binding response OmpR family regulator